MKYKVEMKINGEWKVWGWFDNEDSAKKGYKCASCYGECRIVKM
jgi:hypothetical protein